MLKKICMKSSVTSFYNGHHPDPCVDDSQLACTVVALCRLEVTIQVDWEYDTNHQPRSPSASLNFGISTAVRSKERTNL